jgi:hypothetical protein
MLADDRQSVNLGNLCDGHGLGSANLDGGFAAEPQKAWDIRENDAVGSEAVIAPPEGQVRVMLAGWFIRRRAISPRDIWGV